MKSNVFSVVRAVTFSLAVFAAAPAGAGERLANEDVIAMTRSGIGADVISAKIHSSPNAFDMSTRAILQLNENGVADAVIKAMLAASEAGGGGGIPGDRLRAELAAVASPSPEAREAASAWFIANRAVVARDLRSYLSEADPTNRAAAAVALGRIGDAESVGAIRNLLTDPDPKVRKSAAQALSLLNDQPAMTAAEQAIGRQVNPLDGFIRLVGYGRLTQASDRLGRILAADPSALNRAAAAWALGEIGRSGLAGRPALENALAADPDPEVRREAAAAVARFNDSAAAMSLQNACRADPAVRKTTLAALADYPEAVEFLVGVMALGSDQIAADELEAARAALVRLTGQDFGLDSRRWGDWFAANASRFAAAPAAPRPSASVLPAPGSAAGGHVDMMEAWSIVADSSAIPTAPMPDTAGVPSASGIPVGFSGVASPVVPPPPPAASWVGGEVSGAGASFVPGMADAVAAGVPTLIPDTDIPEEERAAPSAPASPESAGLRTWSSDPARLPPPPGPERVPLPTSASATSPGGDVPGWASTFEPLEPVGPVAGEDSPASWQPLTPVRPTPPPSSAAAAEPVPQAAAFDAGGEQPLVLDAYQTPPGGISLPPPPMGGFESVPSSDGDAEQGVASSPAPSYSAAGLADPGDLEGDPYAEWPSSPLFEDSPAAGDEEVWREIPYTETAPDGSAAFPSPPASSAPLLDAPSVQPFEAADGGDAAGFGVPPAYAPEAGSFDAPYPVAVDAVQPEPVFDETRASESLFVEPEPGQFVIDGDDPSSDSVADAPIPSAVDPFAVPSGEGEEFMAAPLPDASAEPPAETNREAEPFRSSSPEPPPPPPRPEQTDAGPQSQYLAPPPSDASAGFMDLSQPLPPVRPEGTVSAPAGKDVPLLGEGFF